MTSIFLQDGNGAGARTTASNDDSAPVDNEWTPHVGGFASSDEECNASDENDGGITGKAQEYNSISLISRHAYARPAMMQDREDRRPTVEKMAAGSLPPRAAVTEEESAAISLPKMGNIIREVDCAICFEIMCAPIRLPCCNHVFCRECLIHLKPLKDSRLKCPLCRRKVPNSFDPRRVKVYQPMYKVIKSTFQNELLEHKKELEEKAKSVVLPQKLILQVGNEYREVSNPRKSRNGKYINKHGWMAFVKIFDETGNPLAENLLIRRVHFHLNPYFQDIKQYTAPFSSGWHVGWGYFDVDVTIHWRRCLKKKPMKCSFELAFVEGGTSSTIDVPLNDSQSKIVLQAQSSKHLGRRAVRNVVTPPRISGERRKHTGTWSRAPRDVPARK